MEKIDIAVIRFKRIHKKGHGIKRCSQFIKDRFRGKEEKICINNLELAKKY